MTTINDRIGSQNVIRVLSNASAPPTRLANLGDVDATRTSENGLVLVWSTTAQKFVLTDTISAATIIQTGITSFSNTLSIIAKPGVTSSVTPLFTIFFVDFGSSSWSHIATLQPALTSLGR